MKTKEEIIKEFRKRFKNPKNTGYRVGQEFLGAVEQFLLQALQQTEQRVREEGIKEAYNFIFTELFGEPLDNREARFAEKYPFID